MLTSGVWAKLVRSIVGTVKVFLHVDVSLGVSGVLFELVIAELFFVSVGIEYCFEALAVVVWPACPFLEELNIAFSAGLCAALIILLIHICLYAL